MFTAGDYYLERVTTGRVTFDEEGRPVVSKMQRGAVYEFDSPKTLEELKQLEHVAPEALKPGVSYMRLFQAPVAKFDSEGKLENPRFYTTSFFEINRDLESIVRIPVNVSELCRNLTETVVGLFGELKEDD